MDKSILQPFADFKLDFAGGSPIAPKQSAKTAIGKGFQRFAAVTEIVTAIALIALSGVLMLAGGMGVAAGVPAIVSPVAPYALALVGGGAVAAGAGFGIYLGGATLYRDGMERFKAQARPA